MNLADIQLEHPTHLVKIMDYRLKSAVLGENVLAMITGSSPQKKGCGLHLRILTTNGSQELIISTSNWHQGKLTSLFRLALNKFFVFFCDLAIPPKNDRPPRAIKG
jgi:hypothetical protein